MNAKNSKWTTAPDYHNAKCDYCETKAAYDAKTHQGPWAFMCDAHFDILTSGQLGLGLGQRLIPLNEVK